jgi:predicted transcriptional regulator
MNMADADRTQKADPILVTEIVRSYVAKNSIAVDEIGPLISMVHRTLSGLAGDEPAPAPQPQAPAVPIGRSVQPEYVVCLECGFRAKTLRRHLRMRHGLDPAAYRARWNLKPDHPVTAPAYSTTRSAMARQIGLGRKRSATETPPVPTRRGRARRTPA